MKLSDFEKIYNETYSNTLKFVIVKCNDIDNIKDIIQDTYIELYKKLKKKDVSTDNEKAYVIGISKNIIKRHYKEKRKKYNEISIDENIEITENEDIELNFVNEENVKEIWNFIKTKDLLTSKIFYLYFVLGYTIKEVSKELEVNENTVKTRIYRTIKEIKLNFLKGGIEND